VAKVTLDVDDGPSGLTFTNTPPGRVFVKYVEAGTWAGELGVQHGFELLRIDEDEVDEMDAATFERRMEGKRPFEMTFAQPSSPVPSGRSSSSENDASKASPTRKNSHINSRKSQAGMTTGTVEVDDGPIGLGFEHLPPGKVYVKTVVPSSWAAELGILPGDELVLIDDDDVEDMSAKVFEQHLRNRRPISLTFLESQAARRIAFGDSSEDSLQAPKQAVHQPRSDPRHIGYSSSRPITAEHSPVQKSYGSSSSSPSEAASAKVGTAAGSWEEPDTGSSEMEKGTIEGKSKVKGILKQTAPQGPNKVPVRKHQAEQILTSLNPHADPIAGQSGRVPKRGSKLSRTLPSGKKQSCVIS